MRYTLIAALKPSKTTDFYSIVVKLLDSGINVETCELKDGALALGLTAPSTFFQQEDLSNSRRQELLHDYITDICGLNIQFDCLFPPSDPEFNKKWISGWSSKLLLSDIDIKLLADEYGEEIAYYFAFLRIATIALITLPCIIASIILVTALIAVNLAIEVYFCHYYTGPFKSLVSLLPSVTYAASIPTMVNFYTKAMKRLNELENRVTTRNHDDALTFKGFTVSIIVVFLNLFLVGFLLIPFRDHIDGFFLSEKLTVNMFVDRVKYFVVTGQIIGACTEVVIPFVASKLTSRTLKQSYDLEVQYLKPKFALFDDYLELATQMGFITLFSCAWPLTPLSFLLNNIIELRSDAFKLATLFQKPVPKQVEDIGAWEYCLYLLAWAGSSFLPALCVLYSGYGWQWVFLAAFCNERLFLLTPTLLSWIVSTTDLEVHSDDFTVKKPSKDLTVEIGLLMKEWNRALQKEKSI